jgi:hypothetical protein
MDPFSVPGWRTAVGGLVAASVAATISISACTSGATRHGPAQPARPIRTLVDPNGIGPSGGPVTSEAEAEELNTAPCSDEQLRITATSDTARADSPGATILLFTNTSSSPCRLTGYPTVDVSESGRTQSAVWTPAGYPPDEVIIAPRATASALVTPATASRCDRTGLKHPRLTVTAPGQRRSHQLAALRRCCLPLVVNPIVAGSDGRLSS